MKKKMSLLLTIIILLSFLFPVNCFAAEDSGLQNAITTAKSLLNITNDYDIFDYGISKYGDTTSFNLHWSDSKDKLSKINVTIESSGRITSYYSYKSYENNNRHPKLPSITKDDSLKTAEDFIYKLNPTFQGKIKLRDDTSINHLNDSSYYFNFDREENGVLYPDNMISITIDSHTGDIQNYSCRWNDNITFPSVDNIISYDNSKQIYESKLGLIPVYKLGGNQDNPKPYIAYINVFSNRYIDAKTGDIIYGNSMFANESAKSADRFAAAGSKEESNSLSPEEKSSVYNLSNFIDQQKAEQIARNILKLDNGFKVESINLYKSWLNKSDYIWNISLSKQDKDSEKSGYTYASISIDAKTGEIISFNKSSAYDSKDEVKFDKDQSLKIAQEFAQQMQPEKSNEYEYTNWNENDISPMKNNEKPRQYYFTLTRKTNNLYFPGNGFSITVSTITGEVTGYNFTWYKGYLPESNNIIDSKKAHNLLFDNTGIGLEYITEYPSNTGKAFIPQPPSNSNPNIRLVYALKNIGPVIIDGISGKFLDYSGDPIGSNDIINYSDIEGNFAEKEIKTLAQFGISLPGSKFEPDALIKQKDFLYLLTKSINPYLNDIDNSTNPYDSMYNYLLKSSIVKESEKSTNSSVLKQDAVKFIIRAINYGSIADIKGIYSLPFKDEGSISSDLYGYVAIAYGLNIVKDNNGYLIPYESITRAQAAVLIYNLLIASY